jgi:hypothetical protein
VLSGRGERQPARPVTRPLWSMVTLLLWMATGAVLMFLFTGPLPWISYRLAPPPPRPSQQAGTEAQQPQGPPPQADAPETIGPNPGGSSPGGSGGPGAGGSALGEEGVDAETQAAPKDKIHDTTTQDFPDDPPLHRWLRQYRWALIAGLAALLTGGLYAFLRWRSRRKAGLQSLAQSQEPQGTPVIRPAYLNELRALCREWDVRPPEGATVQDLQNRLAARQKPSAEFDPLRDYHYAVTYTEAPPEPATESRLRHLIRVLRKGK